MSRLKKSAKHAALVILAVAGRALRSAQCRSSGPHVAGFRVLTYHSVSRHRRHETTCSPEAFERQMAFLARETNVLSLTDLVAGGVSPPDPSKPTVAITFDDGYADNLEIALPILDQHRLTATFFALAGYVGTGQCLPHDRRLPGKAARLLSWDEIRALHGRGMAIGSHGITHCRFAALDDDALRREISDSRRRIEAELNAEVRLISFPYGRALDYDARALREVRNAGYAGAATAQYGWNALRGDMFELRRIGIESSDTIFTMRAKLDGALDLLALAETRLCRRLMRLVNRVLGA